MASAPFTRADIAFLAGLAGLWAVVLSARDHYLFDTRVLEQGDAAANSILIEKAVHFSLLVGNYSREGFNHPGPALLYIESFGQDVFYTLLHLVASPYGGQVLAVYLLNALLLAAVTAVFYRHTRSYALATGATAIILWLTNGHTIWASSWMPYMYIAPFLLAVVSGASIASGVVGDLPLYVLATGLLMHGHVSFIPIMGVYSVLVAVTWALRHRRDSRPVRSAVAGNRRAFALSGLLVALFLLPVVLELVLHWPGEWAKYLRYIQDEPTQHPHSLHQGLLYMSRYWPGGTVVNAILLTCGATVTAVAYRARQVPNRAFLLALVGAVTCLTGEVTWYGMRGVDFLNALNAYTGYFYYVVPPLLASAALLLVREMALGSSRHWSIVDRARARLRGTLGTRRPTTLPTCLAVSCVMLIALCQVNFADVYRGEPDLARMTAVIKHDPARHGRVAVIDLQEPYDLESNWPVVAGLVVQASRTGLNLCVNDPNMGFLFASSNMCSSAQSASGYQFAITPRHGPAHPGWRTLWHDSKEDILYPNRRG